MRYGTVCVPIGAEVERFKEGGVISDWFLVNPGKYCPESAMFDGKPSHGYMWDATYRGIRLPYANVKDGHPKFFVA